MYFPMMLLKKYQNLLKCTLSYGKPDTLLLSPDFKNYHILYHPVPMMQYGTPLYLRYKLVPALTIGTKYHKLFPISISPR